MGTKKQQGCGKQERSPWDSLPPYPDLDIREVEGEANDADMEEGRIDDLSPPGEGPTRNRLATTIVVGFLAITCLSLIVGDRVFVARMLDGVKSFAGIVVVYYFLRLSLR